MCSAVMLCLTIIATSATLNVRVLSCYIVTARKCTCVIYDSHSTFMLSPL
jgi:hypothetical protein